jgi:hypothetical protein
MSAMPLVLGHTLDRARWRVLHERVAIRAGPSTRAAIIGIARAGQEVESCEKQNDWVRLARISAPKAAVVSGGNPAAWMLVDGKAVGLGRLLKQLEWRPSVAVTKQSRWDWRVTEVAPGRFRLLPPNETSAPTLARYRVMHVRVAIRCGPSTDSKIIGVLRAGKEVECSNMHGKWIRLAACSAPTPSVLYPEAWMLRDGDALGLGTLLKRCVRKR